MGCVSHMCQKDVYRYTKEEAILLNSLQEYYYLQKTFNNSFNIKAHKRLLSSPEEFILKYNNKIEPKQSVPHIILEKWKLILYGSNCASDIYVKCLGFDSQLQQQKQFQRTYHLKGQNPYQIRLEDLYFHQTYNQIEKDANRAYLVPQVKQDLFEKILKKIANHFPAMGYSLGINYIIGYFLLVGYSQIDCFWLFAHLILNPKFVAMGLFDQNFPLVKILIQIFKNILKRLNARLFDHLYVNIQVMDQTWIMKWFLSFYLSSFPIEVCQYIWDFTLSNGIIGLSLFGVAIVLYQQKQILKCQDQSDLSEIFKSFQNLSKFQNSFNLAVLMKISYQIKPNQSDFSNLDSLPKTFYSEYFFQHVKGQFSKKRNDLQKTECLNKWYNYTLESRQKFTNLAKSSESKHNQFKVQKTSKSQHLQKGGSQQSRKSLKNQKPFLQNNSDKFKQDTEFKQDQQYYPQSNIKKNKSSMKSINFYQQPRSDVFIKAQKVGIERQFSRTLANQASRHKVKQQQFSQLSDYNKSYEVQDKSSVYSIFKNFSLIQKRHIRQEFFLQQSRFQQAILKSKSAMDIKMLAQSQTRQIQIRSQRCISSQKSSKMDNQKQSSFQKIKLNDSEQKKKSIEKNIQNKKQSKQHIKNQQKQQLESDQNNKDIKLEMKKIVSSEIQLRIASDMMPDSAQRTPKAKSEKDSIEKDLDISRLFQENQIEKSNNKIELQQIEVFQKKNQDRSFDL